MNALTNKPLGGVLVEFKDKNLQGNYEKVNTGQDGLASLGAYKRGTVLKYKASKAGFNKREGEQTITSTKNGKVVLINLALSLRPEVCKE